MIMRSNQNPVFRKAIVPWYDSDPVCIILLILLGLVFLFGIAGISVSKENVGYREYIWVPTLLMFMSGGLMISIILRIAKRYIYRYQKRYLKDFNQKDLK